VDFGQIRPLIGSTNTLPRSPVTLANMQILNCCVSYWYEESFKIKCVFRLSLEFPFVMLTSYMYSVISVTKASPTH